ncbi:RNA polymerase sigma factor [Brumimicrobium mesophilum]|uniref:RNA polymerase sigma factor n=1 Tax=Brumimicrobium mesophilum TaxID=392717 RepID=UPI000D144048|nr:sigma-70 family RNA polymerase sigma factor [Brumimicrobium mesophilum]
MKKKQIHFLKLYEPVHEQFERFCRARVYGEMEYSDLMNETLLVGFEKFEKLKSETAFLSFLIGISIRILGSKNQKLREERMTTSMNINQVKDENSSTDLSTDIHFLHESLAKLSVNQKEAIILFELNGYSIKEIAKIQNASESAVKQRLKRGRDNLIQIMNFESTYKIESINHG